MKQFSTLFATACIIACSATALLYTGCDDDDDDDDNNNNPPTNNYNPGPCDDNFVLTEAQPMNFAKAMDICKTSSGGNDWGLLSAKFIRADDTEITVNNQFGIMQKFGLSNNPRRGQRMVVLSTGRARIPNQSNACGTSSCAGVGLGNAPSGIPTIVPGCQTSTFVLDDVGLKLTLRVPPTVTGFSIDHSFFTFDYPEITCNAFNDQFFLKVEPFPNGDINGNSAFDSLGVPIGANSTFMQPNNTGILLGTGFDTWSDAASTGWIRTTVPVLPGTTVMVRLLIFDVGNDASDSSVLLDNFKWLQGNVQLKTTKI